MTSAPVVRTVRVDASPERAFTVFTERIGAWWPLATHSPAAGLTADLAFDGGRLVETGPDGVGSVWGAVVEWDPPRRLAVTWAPTGGPETLVAVDFEDDAPDHADSPGGARTRVVLTHSGWEAYGDQADVRRGSYDGELAWGWVLGLFALALGRPGCDRPGFDPAPLRAGYEEVALALESGPFGPPERGQWSALQVAGHLATNAELTARVVDDVRAGRPARLHGPLDHAPDAVDRFAGLEPGPVADRLRAVAAEVGARCAGLTEPDLKAPVSAYIEHEGVPILDTDGWPLGELLAAQTGVHLPAHAAQIRALRIG